MVIAQAAAVDERWGEYAADEWSDAVVASLKLGGVDYLYFVSGSEIAFWQEATLKAQRNGSPAPRLITVLHEGVALNAAMGSTMVTGQPSATAVHVDVGTLNYGGGLHTAWRGSYPVIMTAGAGPRAYPGSMEGARNNNIQWVQEPRDQGEILRQYTKMDHRLEYQDNPGLIISRLLQVAMSEPRGPVYMTVPREMAMQPLPGTIRFPTRDDLGVAHRAWPDPADARRVAEWLIKADNPSIYTGRSGRNPESVAALVQLAELLALPVMELGVQEQVSFPSTHPLYGSGPRPRDADAMLLVECVTPWISPETTPRRSAKIAWVDIDPVQSKYKTWEYCADMWLPVDATAAAQAIYEAATSLLTQSDMNRIADRRARLEDKKRQMEADAEERALRAGKRRPMHPMWVAYELGKVLEPDAIVLNDALSNGGFVRTFHKRSQAGTHFSSGGSSGGWGPGAAFGAALAKPRTDVVLATGDGFFVYGTPLAALWSAEHYKAPFLTVVFVNRCYSTGTTGARATYPEGVMAETNTFEGGVFDPPPDFAKLAEAGNGYGETVREPEEVGPALRRGLEQVRKGTPAIIAAYLPTLVEEFGLEMSATIRER